MNRQPPPQLKARLWIAGLGVVFFALSPFSLIKSLTAAAFYSAWYGTARMAPELSYAQRRADRFYLLPLALTVLASGFLASIIRLERISSNRFRLVARYVVALALSVFATGVFVW